MRVLCVFCLLVPLISYSEITYRGGSDGLAKRRQIIEGYWLSEVITEKDIPNIHKDGVRVVLSAVPLSDATLASMGAYGIKRVPILMGNTFHHEREILETVKSYPSGQILIHCKYGCDRTGVIAAFILAVHHRWSTADALYSVITRSNESARRLGLIIARHGIDDTRNLNSNPDIGKYAHRSGDGLKTNDPSYVQLIDTTVRSINRHRSNL